MEQAALPATEAHCEFRAWTESRLTPQTVEAVSSAFTPEEVPAEPHADEPEFEAIGYRFCLVESPEGDYPRIRLFNDAIGLAKRLASLEGQEIAAWPFYGLPMSFTKGPIRHLLLPDGTALTIPALKGQEPEVVTTPTDVSDMQEDGFLGPPELVGEVVDDGSEDR